MMNKLKLNAGEYDTYLLYFTKYGCGVSTLVPAIVIFTYPLSSKSSGRKCSVSFRYKSLRHDWHTGDNKK